MSHSSRNVHNKQEEHVETRTHILVNHHILHLAVVALTEPPSSPPLLEFSHSLMATATVLAGQVLVDHHDTKELCQVINHTFKSR